MADFDADGLSPEDTWPFGDMLPGGFDGVPFPGEFSAPETTPPQIHSFSPAIGSAIASNAGITFRITDNSGLFCVLAIFVRQAAAGLDEVAYDGDAFGLQYQGNSTVTEIDSGYEFMLMRREGWLERVIVRALVKDAAGNVAVIVP